MTNNKVNIGIVEDDNHVRENITDFLNGQEQFQCVISVPSVEDYLEASKQITPEVTLMDVELPGMNGIDGARLIKENTPEVEIVMLTIYEDPPKIFEALCAGASGYLLKSTPFVELCSYLEMLKAGGAPMSPRIAYHVVQHFQPKKKRTPSPLSAREHEVVDSLVDGLTYKEVANKLHISIGTVYSHIKNIYKKLHVHSKAELISKSFKGEI